MTSTQILSLVYPLVLGITALGCALALGTSVASSIKTIAAQPKVAGKTQACMIIGCAFIEAIVIYLLISIFLIK